MTGNRVESRSRSRAEKNKELDEFDFNLTIVGFYAYQNILAGVHCEEYTFG